MTKKKKISVSVMCSDLLNLERDIRALERNGVDYLHVDVMDAHLVPNLTFGPDFVRAMHQRTTIPLDIHLMVENPALIISKMGLREGDILSVHIELQQQDFAAMSSVVRGCGAQFGFAINPETSITMLEPYLSITDEIILMLVRPGFASGKMIDGIMDKVGEARRYLDAKGYDNILISVDGSVSCERAHAMAIMGADIFVGGTAGIYCSGSDVDNTIPAFRGAITC